MGLHPLPAQASKQLCVGILQIGNSANCKWKLQQQRQGEGGGVPRPTHGSWRGKTLVSERTGLAASLLPADGKRRHHPKALGVKPAAGPSWHAVGAMNANWAQELAKRSPFIIRSSHSPGTAPHTLANTLWQYHYTPKALSWRQSTDRDQATRLARKGHARETACSPTATKAS